MPLVKIDLIEGRTEEELKILLDKVHESVLEAFDVPEGDRYQIITQHKDYEMILEDTGLGFERTNKMISITLITRKRPEKMKLEFYRIVSEKLNKHCGIEPKDMLISAVENYDSDWSFGFGEAQFITGDL